MIKLKACPKCKGDLRLDRDRFGAFVACLQCGYTKEVEVAVVKGEREPKTSRKKKT